MEPKQNLIATILNMPKNEEAAIEFILDGGICIYRRGWAYRGAKARVMDFEETSAHINRGHWGFGIGPTNLRWTDFEGQIALEFNELDELDLE